MSAQTKFKIEDAEDLLQQLQQFQEILNEEWSRVLTQWSNLKYVWNDQQFDQFESLFEKLIADYRDTQEKNEKYISFLQQEIKIADERNKILGNLKNL
jgi:predicted nuclease with TOPRIM domain